MRHSSGASCLAPRALLGDHYLLVATPEIIAPPCRRPAATLLLSTNGRPFQLSVPKLAPLSATAALIAPRQQRILQARGCDLLSVNIEPGHDAFLPLLARLEHAPVMVFPPDYFHGLLTEMRALYDGQIRADAVAAALDTLLDAGGNRRRRVLRDARIALVLRQVHAELPGKIALPLLADMAGLSPDRLSHLFVASIGMPLRTYVVWQRYKLAVRQISGARGLAALASSCGFADAAHMTRTFVDFFGLSPSALLRSGFVQDYAQQT